MKKMMKATVVIFAVLGMAVSAHATKKKPGAGPKKVEDANKKRAGENKGARSAGTQKANSVKLEDNTNIIAKVESELDISLSSQERSNLESIMEKNTEVAEVVQKLSEGVSSKADLVQVDSLVRSIIAMGATNQSTQVSGMYSRFIIANASKISKGEFEGTKILEFMNGVAKLSKTMELTEAVKRQLRDMGIDVKEFERLCLA